MAGASSSGGATGSAGGAQSSQCAQPQDSGPCRGYLPSFWHDPVTGLCIPFVYGGCGGNLNHFETREACLAACPGGGSDAGACQSDADCTLTGPGCCAACEPISNTDLLALNVNSLAQLHKQQCPVEAPCAPCMSVTEYEESLKYFKPVCRSGQCSLLDVRQAAMTACMSDSDCSLRNGVGCCEECDATGYVAVNVQADLCEGVRQGCDACASEPPLGLKPVCTAGHCALALPIR